MTRKQMFAELATLMAKAPAATVAIPGFGVTSARPAAQVARKPADATATIVETVPFKRVRFSGRPSKAQIADLKAMGAFAHRTITTDGSEVWYWLVPSAS